MSDEPSNFASEALLASAAFLSEGPLTTDLLRALLTDDYAYEDRRRGVGFPDADAESYPNLVISAWELGTGRPEFRSVGDPWRAGRQVCCWAGPYRRRQWMLLESIHVLALDATLCSVQREVDFHRADIDAAIAEMDRLQSQADAG